MWHGDIRRNQKMSLILVSAYGNGRAGRVSLLGLSNPTDVPFLYVSMQDAPEADTRGKRPLLAVDRSTHLRDRTGSFP
jgi:hypothetical protein